MEIKKRPFTHRPKPKPRRRTKRSPSTKLHRPDDPARSAAVQLAEQRAGKYGVVDATRRLALDNGIRRGTAVDLYVFERPVLLSIVSRIEQ